MAVHAHPDDECFGTGGVLACYSRRGLRTVLVTCTRGEAGEIADPELATPETLAEVRAQELAESVRILGISRAAQLGYRDSGMVGTADNEHPASFHQADLEEATGRLVALVRQERPDVLVSYDERGGYGHPDHVKAHLVTVAAFHAAGDPGRYPEAGPAWAPRKLYFSIFPRSAIRRFAETLREAGLSTPFGERRGDEEPPIGVGDERITAEVDVAPVAGLKLAALLAHRTQLASGMAPTFLGLPVGMAMKVLGREFYQRVAGPGPARETDLLQCL